MGASTTFWLDVSRRRVAAVACALALLAPSPARATVLRAMDLTDLCRVSDVIVRGRVLRTRAAWSGGRIVTAVTLRVEANWLGAPHPGTTLTVNRLGGEVGGIGQVVLGAPRFRPGERVVLFLRRVQGRLRVTGMAQGKLRLARRGAGGPLQVFPPVVDVPRLGSRRVLRAPVPLRVLRAAVRARLRRLGRLPAPGAGGGRP